MMCLVMCGLVLAVSMANADAQRAPQDDAALTGLVDRWVAARNAHDTTALQALFADDADVTRLSNGEVVAPDRAGIVRWYEAGFAREGGKAVARVTSRRARLLAPDVGLVDFAFTLTGAGGEALTAGRTTFVCVRRSGAWTVAAVRFASDATAR